MLLGMATFPKLDLTLFFSQEWLGEDGKLDPRCPLRELPKKTFPFPENSTERRWKLISRPLMDGYLPEKVDWVYAPMETYIPVKKCPVAVTIHDIQAFESELPWAKTWRHRFFRFKWGRWVHRALKDCRVVFTVSEFSKQRMVEVLGGDPNKIVVVENGVEESFFKMATVPQKEIEPPIDLPYTIVIGGLRDKKGAVDTLAVARSLLAYKSELQIVVAGNSEPEYIEAAKDLPNVHLLGLVEEERLPRLIRGASSLLFLTPYEGFGIPALEAMAAGIPVVVSNRASLPEVVRDSGFVVEPNETEKIVDILTHLVNDTTLWNEYSQRGRERASLYTWDRSVETVISTLNKFA
jgi:glycosyltransferase involved in cell wall biosynthesis